ncbi:hypothetical protein Aspvir_009916 [Aspergillus viridinutans]|uniref:Uncharacterized protein n=1 Tax=Aspergillus viridinutans TaxID=75553 RepID=A0A9P3F8U4_ASPVI|nr:uncharacterized protein Aspvir_009916 [Aspergillus viridinutans]GIK05803.1 hypothetical protein Aspvir_009916 [Aspergillus viridinutans]
MPSVPVYAIGVVCGAWISVCKSTGYTRPAAAGDVPSGESDTISVPNFASDARKILVTRPRSRMPRLDARNRRHGELDLLPARLSKHSQELGHRQFKSPFATLQYDAKHLVQSEFFYSPAQIAKFFLPNDILPTDDGQVDVTGSVEPQCRKN